MKTWIYSWIVYPLLFCLASIAGVFKPKIRHTLRLRAWKDFLSLRFNASTPIEYWIHVASAGELEYAIPLIEELQKLRKQVLVTYYSISAKDAVERLPIQYSNVSLVVPLPHDGLGLMSEFVKLIRGQGVRVLLLMKYELWPGLLWECQRKNLKVVLVDALKPGWFHRRLLHKLSAIIGGYHGEIVGIEHPQVFTFGDTRVERVITRLEKSKQVLTDFIPSPLLLKLQSQKTFVFGSMWPGDDKILETCLSTARGLGINLIWVPHEIHVAQALRMKDFFSKAQYKVYEISDLAGNSSRPEFESSVPDTGPCVLMVLRKGILTELYRLGTFAFVGGGFGDGIHSVWEPAIAKAKVACGPRRHRSPESFELESAGVLTEIRSSSDLEEWILSSQNTLVFNQDGLNHILAGHSGAAQRIISYTEKNYGRSEPLSNNQAPAWQ